MIHILLSRVHTAYISGKNVRCIPLNAIPQTTMVALGAISNTFSFQPVLHDWCNEGRGMCYPVCGMVHINLLLIDKSSLCGGSGFPFSLTEWSLTMSDAI